MNVLFMSMPVPEDMERDGMHIMPPMALYLLGAIIQNHGHNVLRLLILLLYVNISHIGIMIN